MIYVIRTRDVVDVYYAKDTVSVLNYETWYNNNVYSRLGPEECSHAWHENKRKLDQTADVEYLRYLELCGLSKLKHVEIDVP